MSKKLLTTILSLSIAGSFLTSCSKERKVADASNRDTINISLGDDVPTLDPTLAEDTTSSRVAYDLFEGLTSFDQSNRVIPGLADKWDVSADNKTYTFHLRDGIKFSNGSPITADDVVFTWQRLINPKTASNYNYLAFNIVNGKDIANGKKPVASLGVKALDAHTVQITLVEANPTFLTLCSMPNASILSKANITKYGNAWTNPKNMVTSGAYKLSERVVKGYIKLTKNDNYYDVEHTKIKNIKFIPISDQMAELSMYKSGGIDITWTVPVDQYKNIKKEMPKELHTVMQEALYYYDFNLKDPVLKNNIKLRQALSMAVDREMVTKTILGQGQVPDYTFTSYTVEGGKFKDTNPEWANWSRDKQITEAKRLYAEAGYGPTHPLSLHISYNTLDLHQKIALAIGSMWQQTLGVKVEASNQEWKTFIQARNNGNYQVARDAWVADYDSVNTYIDMYRCDNAQNKAKFCDPKLDALLDQAASASDDATRTDLIRQALQIGNDAYATIPLYQYTYFRLISPVVKGYDIDDNHLDHVQTKWFSFN